MLCGQWGWPAGAGGVGSDGGATGLASGDGAALPVPVPVIYFVPDLIVGESRLWSVLAFFKVACQWWDRCA